MAEIPLKNINYHNIIVIQKLCSSILAFGVSMRINIWMEPLDKKDLESLSIDFGTSIVKEDSVLKDDYLMIRNNDCDIYINQKNDSNYRIELEE